MLQSMKWTKLSVILLLFAVNPTARAAVITPKFWNHYKGLSYPRAIEKKHFNKCELEMSVNSDGVTISRYLGEYYFHVHYPPSTITFNQVASPNSESAGAEQIYALHDSKKSDPNETLLVFLETGQGTTKVASIEGHSQMPLALFFQDNEEAESLLHKQYDSVLKIMTRDPSEQNDEMRARSHLMQNPQNAKKSLEMLGTAIRDGDFKVQLAALSRIHDEYIIPPAVPLVTSLIIAAEHSRYSEHVIGSAVDLALILLHEAYADVKTTNQLKLIYGTTDLRRIHNLTKGRVSADKLPLLEFAANPPASDQTWTAHDVGTLISALSFVIQNHALFSSVDVSHLKAELHHYSNPFGACAAALSGNTSQLVN